MSLKLSRALPRLYCALLLATATPSIAIAGMGEQHSVDAIVAALKTPIAPEAVTQAREFDDGVMSSGKAWDQQVYLVTDERYSHVDSLASAVLRSAGEDPQQWVVRVLDTNPKVVNAFVVCGKYIYVFTGLLDLHPSDSEMAFILSHEIGHSMLKHSERRANDPTSTVAALANLIGLFSKKNQQSLSAVSQAMTASYSRGDEEEADVIGVCLARRAGYDPMRGVDLFTHFLQERDERRAKREQALAQAKADYDQAQTNCTYNHQLFNSATSYQTQANADKVNALCADAESKRVHYNEVVEWYNAQAADEQKSSLFLDHPADQARIATVAALTDYLAGRRDIESLAKYQQSSRVIEALQEVRPDFLKADVVSAALPTAAQSAPTAPISGRSLEEALGQLKEAHAKGLLTDAEYAQKRQETLAKY